MKPVDLQWETCPPGVLAGMSERLKIRRQRRRFLKTASIGTGVSALAGLAALGVWNLGDDVIRLDCVGCKKLMPDYAGHRLDKGLSRAVAQHLSQCRPCRIFYEKEFTTNTGQS